MTISKKLKIYRDFKTSASWAKNFLVCLHMFWLSQSNKHFTLFVFSFLGVTELCLSTRERHTLFSLSSRKLLNLFTFFKKRNNIPFSQGEIELNWAIPLFFPPPSSKRPYFSPAYYDPRSFKKKIPDAPSFPSSLFFPSRQHPPPDSPPPLITVATRSRGGGEGVGGSLITVWSAGLHCPRKGALGWGGQTFKKGSKIIFFLVFGTFYHYAKGMISF